MTLIPGPSPFQGEGSVCTPSPPRGEGWGKGQSQVEYDAARTAWLNERGYRVIRFANRDVERNLEAVLEAVLAECQEAIRAGNPARMSNV